MEAPPSDVPVPAPAAAVAPGSWERELDRIESGLGEVERALVRLEDGTYGTCEVCAVRIDDDVLGATPTARRCPDHG